MEDRESSKIRTVNQSLGDTPSVGPISGNQLVPWALLLVFAWLVKGFLGLGDLEFAVLAVWLIFSWTVLSGTKPWKYLSKYISVPYWTCGYLSYKPLLTTD